MRKSVFIKSSVAIVELISKDNIIYEILNDEFLYAYIPSLEILENVDKKNVRSKITVEVQENNEIVIDFPNIYYYCQKINTKDIISLIEYTLERIRQEEGIICIHGAGSVYKNKLIVCWGSTTGMGKTTLALELSNNDCKFYSDEKILIDLKKMKAIGRLKKQYISNKYWKEKLGNKQYVDVDNLTEDIYYDIGIFIQPIICNQNNYILDEWDNKKFFWHLYEESSRKIRGTSRTFFDATYPIDSFDNKKIATQRLNLIKDLCNNISCIYYKGNEKNIINYIKNKLK